MKHHSKYTLLLGAMLVFIHCREMNKKENQTEKSVVKDSTDAFREGRIEAYEDDFWKVVPRDAEIEVLAEGHDWTEGPLWVEKEGLLLYTDIPRNAVYAWQEGREPWIYLKPSGFLGTDFGGKEPGANGLLLDEQGQLVLCQHGERRIALMKAPISDPRPEFETLAGNFEGKRFNSPNDAVMKSDGSLYFTDPPYGLPGQMEDPGKEIGFQGVYRLDAEGSVRLLTDTFTRPNGIAFSPDERTLYIANSDPEMAIWKAFDVGADGLLGNERVFYDATSLVSREKGLPDGLKVDASGNLFATAPGGVLIFSPEGELLGRIHTGQATSNCAFNDAKDVLFITADSYVLRVRLDP